MELWQRRVRITCVAVLLLALVLRLGGSISQSAQEALWSKSASFLLYLQTGRVAKPTVFSPAQPTITPPTQAEETTPPETPPETTPPLAFPPEQAQNIAIKYNGEYRPDLAALLAQPVDLDFSGSQPRVLIIHTHATESYTQVEGWTYEDAGNFRTLDTSQNMIRVGQAIADILEAAGIPVLHDTSLNDYPSYNSSYDRTLTVIEEYLAQYPTIEMVIDVHRDAIELSDGSQMGTAALVGGGEAAQIMLVVGTDEGGLTHPNWQGNLSWALKIQAQMDAIYPGLARPLSLSTQRYNQHATPGSLLVEVGTAGDTMPEALAGAEAFARTLVSLIQGLGLD